MNETTVLPSGAVLTLIPAPFSTSTKLLKVLARELKSADLKLDLEPATLLDFGKFSSQSISVDAIKSVVCAALASDALEQALGECAGRCLYEGTQGKQKLDFKTTFEAAEARKDFLPVAWEVLKLNLAPFFEGLVSRSSTRGPESGASPS